MQRRLRSKGIAKVEQGTLKRGEQGITEEGRRGTERGDRGE